MIRHTPETVRAACERARIPCADVPWFVEWSSPLDCIGLWGIGSEQVVSELVDGTLIHKGNRLTDRYHPNEQRAEAMDPRDARIVELEERVRVLRAALEPFAEADLPDEEGAYGFERGPMVNARTALAATEEK